MPLHRRSPAGPQICAWQCALISELAHDLALLETEGDFLLRRFRAVGAVHRVLLMVHAEILADGAGSGIDGIGRAHHLAVSGDGILAFQHLHHDRARGHKDDQVLVIGLALMHLVELLGVLLSPPDALLRDYPEARSLEPCDDLPGEVALGDVWLDDGESTLDGHGRRVPLKALNVLRAYNRHP